MPVDVRLGGLTTVFADGEDAYGFSARNLSRRDSLTFAAGRGAFTEPWAIAPGEPSTQDGLGPTYNAESCVSCHLGHGRGVVPADGMDRRAGLLVRLSVPGVDEHGGPLPEPTYGRQLQDRATTWAPQEGRVSVTYDEVAGTYGDGTPYTLRRPTFRVGDLQFGPLAPGTQVSARVAPALVGMGLLEAIPADQVRTGADPADANGDGVSGRANEVWDSSTQSVALGRFGWKAGQPSVAQQTAVALSEDLGITSTRAPSPNCPGPQDECRAAPAGGAPEASDAVFEPLTFYTRTLAVPAARAVEGDDGSRGSALFTDAGCAACHRPTWTTGDDPVSGLRDQTIHPYTDLLVHDLGADLADDQPEYAASGAEWRTAPLWGIGLTQRVTPGAGFLHDGRARTLAEAILWHGGEAEPARERFRTMAADDRAALLRFVESR